MGKDPGHRRNQKISKRIHAIIILLIGALVSALVFPPDSFAARKKRKATGSCRSIILMNSQTGKGLYQKNIHGKVLPASTAKVMTAILVLEKLSLDQIVVIGSRATSAEPSKINSKAGEKFKVRDLLYALLLKSANDASIALAEAVAGSHREFVKMMNARARQLGARNTKFANASGLPTKAGTQYTTAYDMALIFRQALKNPFFRDAVHLKYKTISSLDGRVIKLSSHNKILFYNWRNNIYGKTGYTRAAQQCFVGAVQRGKDTLIIGVFGCNNRWGNIRYVVSRYGGVAL